MQVVPVTLLTYLSVWPTMIPIYWGKGVEEMLARYVRLGVLKKVPEETADVAGW